LEFACIDRKKRERERGIEREKEKEREKKMLRTSLFIFLIDGFLENPKEKWGTNYLPLG
jgi:hypothetical protein